MYAQYNFLENFKVAKGVLDTTLSFLPTVLRLTSTSPAMPLHI